MRCDPADSEPLDDLDAAILDLIRTLDRAAGDFSGSNIMEPPSEVIDAARASQRKYGVPASISLAQWALESGWGKHAPGNNPFGMKPRKGMNDPQQMLMTTEWSKARGYYKVPQPFRVFPSIAAAFDAHAELLATAPVYAPAFAALPDVDGFIDRMAAHYATAPIYASKIKSMIRHSNLGQYDEVSA